MFLYIKYNLIVPIRVALINRELNGPHSLASYFVLYMHDLLPLYLLFASDTEVVEFFNLILYFTCFSQPISLIIK